MIEWKELVDYPAYKFSNKGEVKSYHGIVPTLLNPQQFSKGIKS